MHRFVQAGSKVASHATHFRAFPRFGSRSFSRSSLAFAPASDAARLTDLEAEFKELVHNHLPSDGKGVAFATGELLETSTESVLGL